MATFINNSTTYSAEADHFVKAVVTQENISTLNVTSEPDGVSWCHDLQGSDFIYTPTLYTTATRHAIAAAFILLIIVTVVGNALVIITVVVDKPLKKITRTLIVSMAASDILVALCGELQSVVTMLSRDAWGLSDIWCEIFTSADLYFSLSGILHIVCLAADRYLAICHPFKYGRVDRKFLTVSVISAWTLPVLFSFLPILAQWHRLGLSDLYACLQDLETHVCTMIPNKAFSTITFTIMFGLPSILLIFCYRQIYRAAMAQKEKMSSVTLGSYTSVEPVHATNVLKTRTPSDPALGVNEEINVTTNLIMSNPTMCRGNTTFETQFPLKLGYTLQADTSFSSLEQTKVDKKEIQHNSCPGFSVFGEDLNMNNFHQSVSLGNLLDYSLISPRQQHEVVASRKTSFTENKTKRLRTGSPKPNVTFSIAPSTDDEEQSNSSPKESSKPDCPIKDKNESVSSECHHRHHISSNEKINMKSKQKPESCNGSHVPIATSKELEIIFNINKNRLKQKLNHFRSHKHGFMSEDFRTARSLSIIGLCFAMTWCPYWVTMLVMPYLGPGSVPDPLIGACLWLAYVGSALNPFVYYFSNNSVKRGIKKRFLKIFKK